MLPKKKSTRDVMCNMMSTANTAVWYAGKLLEEKFLRVLITRKNFFSFLLFFFFFATLHSMWDLSSLTRDWTRAPCTGSAESEPLDRPGSPLPFFLFYLYEKMDISWTYCGNHFTIYVNHTIMLYALNLHSDVCQLFLNTTGKESTLAGWKEARGQIITTQSD